MGKNSVVTFQAWSKGAYAYGITPQAAAHAFFSKYPTKRKCSINEGVHDGYCFTIRVTVGGPGQGSRSWADVTPKSVVDLPSE